MILTLIIYLHITLLTVVSCKNVRVIGGEDATINEFPYIASFRLQDNNIYLCAGAIISNWHILSAAHCFIDFPNGNIKVYVGVDNFENEALPYRAVKAVKLHPDFSGRRSRGMNSENDIAVVLVNPCIPFNEFQHSIGLPTEDVFSNQMSIFSGWGWTSYPEGTGSKILQKVQLKIISNAECDQYFRYNINDEQLCTFEGVGTGICFGDSGGPLVSNGVLVGICSFARPCANGRPDVFSRVFSHLDFIRRSMFMKKPKPCLPFFNCFSVVS